MKLIIKPAYKYLYLPLLLSILLSCDDPNEIGLELEDENMAGYYSDTVTVEVSTVLLDSLVTSGSGALLAGTMYDPLIGNTSANAYFQVGLGSGWFLNNESGAVFESMELVLPYNTYSYGDTIQNLTLQIHQLQEQLTPYALQPYVGTEEPASYFYAASGLYNASRTQASAHPLASYTFKPRPRSADSLFVPLPQEMGQEWFNLGLAQDQKLLDDEAFSNFFKGLKLSAQPGGGNSIIGFKAEQTFIRLNYSLATAEGRTTYHYDFPLITGSTQYNQLLTDGAASQLATIDRGGEPLESTATDNMAFAQAGTGLMVRIDFPHLENLKNILVPELINAVQLEVQPVANTIKYPFAAPAYMALYETDQHNKPTYPLLMDYSTEDIQQASLVADDEYGLNSKYSFNITHYFISRLKNTGDNRALLLSVPPGYINQTLERLVIGGQGSQTNKVRLKLYYVKIQ